RSFCSTLVSFSVLFLFTATATPQIYTLSLHDALPISSRSTTQPATVESGAPSADSNQRVLVFVVSDHLDSTGRMLMEVANADPKDRKSTRLNSSHDQISYAVFCLKKKKKKHQNTDRKK